VLNERVFRRGRETRALPAIAVFAASNRLPEDDALGALFDRFLLRVMCENVPGDRLGDVLRAGWELDRPADAAKSLDIEDIRRLYGSLALIDLSGIRPKLAELIVRLRDAGMAISDRRAVKFQRLIVASALLCGRTAAILSDLWVLRHVWDTLEQREVLAAIVNDALKDSPVDAKDHPRSRSEELPDAESLARDLEQIENSLADARLGDAERSAAKDRLGILAGRVQWVKDKPQREVLLQRVEKLWSGAKDRK
jgi:MoxR-like ATPase